MKPHLKQLLLLLLFAGSLYQADAQVLRNLKEKAKEKVKTKANEKVETTMDKGLNKASETIDTVVNRTFRGDDNNPNAGPAQLEKTGKYVTTQIHFEEGSDQVKADSYALLKELSKLLKQIPDMRVKIVCHTDNDGDADMNLKLTASRALSIKNVLSSIFDIDTGRLETEGQGGNQPLSKNKSEEAKALNRRVEFIRL